MTSIAILEAVNTTAVQFHGQPIITAMVAGVVYIAMRPIVENIGIDWTGQTVKLKNQKDKFNCRDISMVAADGKIRKLLCIPLRKLNGWLFSINPEKVRADIRDKLIQYQEECFSVLHEYWTKGEVVNPRKRSRQSSATQLTPLRQTAERLIATGLGKIYPDI
ncbi:phage antirepressor N-terminal domain-containing protein, partial [Yersinia enterocolitica]